MQGSPTRHADVAIVGAGIAGLAAADALAQRGADVVCIEAGRPGGAQSAGLARLLHAHHDHVDMIAPCQQSIAHWRKWEQRFSRRLLGRERLLAVGGDPGAALAELEHAGAAAELVELTGARFPLLSGEAATGPALFEHDAGVIRARRTVALLAAELRESIVHAHVLALAEHDEAATVVTNEGRIRARHVLVCAGAATAAMASSCDVSIPVERDMHLRLTFPIAGEHDAQLPCWVDRRERFGPSVYGLPVGRTGGYAIGIGGREGDVPLAREQLYAGTGQVADVDATARALCDYVREAMPGLVPEPVFARSCLITQLPWGGDHIGVWSSAGRRMSFLVGNNMFMFAPLLGQRLADVAQGAAVADWLDPVAHAARTPRT